MGQLIIDILRAGTSVVLDFAGNTVAERKWVRQLSEEARSFHTIHFLNIDEEECLRRVLNRNESKPDGLYFASTTEEEFRAVCKWFQPPQPEEELNGARAAAMRIKRDCFAIGGWMNALEARAPRNVLVVAMTNKLARIEWAVLSTGENYRSGVILAAA